MQQPTLYLIRGVPAAGKSSFAATLKEAGVVQHICEADQYFEHPDNGYIFEASKLKEAHSSCQSRTLHWLDCGHSVAVSNTSTTEKEVQTYQEIANKCKAKFVSIVLENRHGCSNIHGVPEEKVQQMKDRFSIKL